MEVKKIMVIGAGQMGSGIAQVCAQAGYTVILNDVKEEFARARKAGISKNLERRFQRKNDSGAQTGTLSRITLPQV